MTDSSGRTPLVLVAGIDRTAVARAATALLDEVPGTVAVHHDVRATRPGRRRPYGPRLRSRRRHDQEHHPGAGTRLPGLHPPAGPAAPAGRARCSGRRRPHRAAAGPHPRARAPLLGRRARPPRGHPRAPGDRAETASAYVDVEAVVVTVGQLAVADVVLLHGQPEGGWSAARLHAVLDPLVHGSVRAQLDHWRPAEVLDALGPDARRGRPSTAHDPLLPGQPPLGEDAGVALVRFGARRPFHPERLHDALDVLLDGVVCSRGRLWLAARHDQALWLESAGGGLRIGDAGPWLATSGDDPELWAQADDQRRVSAALRWDPLRGDRDSEIAVLTHRRSPAAVIAALDAALLTDEELTAGPAAWAALPDPFGARHEDPSGAGSPADGASTHATTGEDHP